MSPLKNPECALKPHHILAPYSPCGECRRDVVDSPFLSRLPSGYIRTCLFRVESVFPNTGPISSASTSDAVLVFVSFGLANLCVATFRKKPFYPDSNKGADVLSQYPFLDFISHVSGNCHTCLPDLFISPNVIRPNRLYRRL